MSKKVFGISVLINVVLLLAIACGGGSTSTSSGSGGGSSTTPPTAHAMNFSAVAGFHATIAKMTSAVQPHTKRDFFSFVPSANAQAQPTVSLTGSFNGFCQQTPGSNFVVPSSAAVVLYGGGSLSSTDCDNFFNFGGSGISPGEGAAQTASAQGSGQLIVGNGTIGPFVAYDTAASTHVGDSSAVAEVWVVRSNAVMNSNITVTLGSSHRAQSTSTFDVLDGDLVIVTVTVQPGDVLHGFQYYLLKQ